MEEFPSWFNYQFEIVEIFSIDEFLLGLQLSITDHFASIVMIILETIVR